MIYLKHLEGKAICALASYSNKISYYLLKYKELFKSPNIHLRENPKMGNIFEVHESDDSTFMDNNTIQNKKIDIKNGSGEKGPLKKNNKNIKNDNDKINKNGNNNSNINNNDMNSLGISKFINNADLTNISISLNDISSSKIENESLFVKNAMDMIGQNNLIQSNNKKIINLDDIPLQRNKSIDKNKKDKNNETKNSIDEQVDKLMIGDISNMSDISDNNISENKNDLTLGIIFGNKNSNEMNNNNNITNKNNVSIISNNLPNNNNEKENFKEFGEKDMDEFFGKSSQNKNLDISAIQSFSIENEGALFDFPTSTYNKKIFQESSLKENKNTSKSTNINEKEEKIHNVSKDKKMTLDELASNTSTINNKSFLSLKSNETLGIDFTQFIEENGMLNETKHIVPPSQDISIL